MCGVGISHRFGRTAEGRSPSVRSSAFAAGSAASGALRGSQEAALFDYRHKHFKLHEFHIEFSPFFCISIKRTRPLSISDNGLWHWIDFFCAGRYPVSAFTLIRPISTTTTARIPFRWEARKAEEDSNKLR